MNRTLRAVQAVETPGDKEPLVLRTRPCPKCGQVAVLLNRIGSGPHQWGCGHCGWTETTARELTPREIEITKLLCEGLTCKELSASLGCSVKTIETHRANIMHKLKLHNIVGLLRLAVKNRLINL
jgi:DNA-binding CsgD family transcriptional regulator/ribosomal protein S27AE